MSRRRCRPATMLACLLVLALSALLLPSVLAGGTAEAGASQTRSVPLAELTVVTEQVAFGLRRPIAITGLPDGRMLIAEKNGTVRAYHPDTGLAPDPLLDIRDRVDVSGNERGLLGIAPVQVILTQEHAEFSNHNGGHVAFGPADGGANLGWSSGQLSAGPCGSFGELTGILAKPRTEI